MGIACRGFKVSIPKILNFFVFFIFNDSNQCLAVSMMDFFFFILGVEKKSILGLLLVLNRLLLMRIHKKTFNETTTNTRFYIGFILGLQVGDDYIASVRGTWHFHRRL